MYRPGAEVKGTEHVRKRPDVFREAADFRAWLEEHHHSGYLTDERLGARCRGFRWKPDGWYTAAPSTMRLTKTGQLTSSQTKCHQARQPSFRPSKLSPWSWPAWGWFQALLLTAYLLTISQRRRLAHRLFALMLIGLSIRIGKSIFNYYLDIEPWQRNIGLAGLLLVGPSFWLYGKAIGERLSGLSKRHWLHFAPAALYVLFCWLIPNQKNWASYLSYALVTGQWAIYLVLSFRQSRGITQTLSLEAKTWHRQILIGLVVLWFYYALVFVGVLPYYLGGAVTYTLLMGGLTVLLLNRKHFSAGKYDQTNQSSEESRSAMARYRAGDARTQTVSGPQAHRRKTGRYPQLVAEAGVTCRE